MANMTSTKPANENVMRISITHPSNEIDKLTTDFASFGLKLAAARASDPNASHAVRTNAQIFLRAKNIPFPSTATSYVSDNFPGTVEEARKAIKCDSILQHLQSGMQMSKAKPLTKWAKARKGLGSAKDFDEYAERAQFPEQVDVKGENRMHQWFHPGPYIPPKRDHEKEVSEAVKAATVQRIKKEKEKNKLSSTIKEMLAEVDWEQERRRFDVYGDVDMDFESEKVPERKLHRAGQRTLQVRQVNTLMSSFNLGEDADSKASKVSKVKSRVSNESVSQLSVEINLQLIGL